MQLFRGFIFILCSPISLINGFFNTPTQLLIKDTSLIKNSRQRHSFISCSLKQETPPFIPPKISDKLQGYINLTRINKNFIPTTILNVLNGMVTNPSHITTWIINPNFITASIMIYLFTAGSMVLNDLFDINVDKINNPNRPLITGLISPREAIIFTTILFSFYIFLGVYCLPNIVSPIWKVSFISILLYTPILKKIPFIKNLTCASIITSTVPFIGLSINPGLIMKPERITDWVPLTMRTLFITSLFIEIMLDISDRDGDAKTGIKTLPVLFGSQKTLWGLTLFLNINYIQSILLCIDSSGIFQPFIFIALFVSYFPLFMNIFLVQRKQFSNESIKKSIISTTGSMVSYFIIYIIYYIVYGK